MVGRHRHAVNVRVDGLATVLGPLLRGGCIRAAALVDVDSGMVLDAFTAETSWVDLEGLGGTHAELMRVGLGLLGAAPPSRAPGAAPAGDCEIVLSGGPGAQHVVRLVPDPYGERLALSVVVVGNRRAVERVRRGLREISVAALTSGPTASVRFGGKQAGSPRPGSKLPGTVVQPAWPPPVPVPAPPVASVPAGPPAVPGPADPAMAILQDAAVPRPPSVGAGSALAVPVPIPLGAVRRLPAPQWPPPRVLLPMPPPGAPRPRDDAAVRPPAPPAALPPARRRTGDR
ncbi:hypothetical protein [Pseudonocardia sp. GCM10023141]|uniref:hypothetical protein n=1 Tax=Pseudonocardia sp. GCM10023141 TaxID=3252653 RepID=UPI00360A844C